MDKVNLTIKNVNIFNSYFKKFINANVHILDGRIYYIDTKKTDKFKSIKTIDGTGKYMIPGLVDIHMHIESSMMAPEPFCAQMASCGVTTIVSEPHEMANAAGVDGILHMIEAGKKSLIDVYYGIPSSVPSTNANIETTGGEINFNDMKNLLSSKNVICVGEVMNSRKIIEKNDLEITKLLKYLRKNMPNYVIEGHCPSLTDLDLAKYLYLGINSDHTEHSLEEIRQRFLNGMFVEIQGKMLKKNIIEYIINNDLYEHCCFVTDDTMADKLYECGHLNVILKKAVSLGFSIENAIYCSTFTASRRMNLRDRGSLAPGKLADFILLDNIYDFHIVSTYKRGIEVYNIENKTQWKNSSYSFPENYYNSICIKNINKSDFSIPVKENVTSVTVRTIEVVENSTQTKIKEIQLPVENHQLKWQGSGCMLAMVIERYGKNGNVGIGLVTGSCIKRGAAATTHCHDHHNLMVIGENIDDMMLAINRIKELQGGIVTACNGKILSQLQLNICGIISGDSADKIGTSLKEVRNSLESLGYRHNNPISSLCTLSLPVSPALKLTDFGLVDVKNGSIVPLYKI
ncbi:adenine deaminase [Clostridium sp. cel8]|uniref:adenine deaminase C-terminal domain-containing protein n=1 Tax=Clostridium sp. cel8 TaxID=2663123 RepID=UPI0015F664BF|nr:adenine deaminase C-terminal domain-containing protein [Clostridium sp. cel8]MBA5851119.1 adenine deaminase [Clostridium sp. cel8]